jgi:hypothetical protein
MGSRTQGRREMPEEKEVARQEGNPGRCPDCGAGGTAGRAGCQARFDKFAARAYSESRWARWHDLAFDTYCMQHPGRYCRSAKSYAAHLARLCCGLEYGGSPRIYAAIQRWLNGRVEIERPSALSPLGEITVADLALAQNPQEFGRRVQRWAQSVWQAYTPQQDLARAWIQAALREAKAPPARRNSWSSHCARAIPD